MAKLHEYDKALFRIVRIIMRLGHGEILSIQELAEEFGVSDRTIRRDIKDRIGHHSMRSKASSVISGKFSTLNQDDWWHDMRSIDRKLIEPVMLGVKSSHRIGIPSADMTTYDFFDSMTFNQLLNVYSDFWSDFRMSFTQKAYKTHTLLTLDKKQFEAKLRHIRSVRNDIAHHKPINHSSGRRRQDLIEDIELILCHLGFNLDEAVNNIDPNHSIIQLRYI